MSDVFVLPENDQHLQMKRSGNLVMLMEESDDVIS